ncbi:hypothetical protein [Pseudoalteromonas sp. ECSMB14103]|uniref:hypothetical protein n=1 Tax=Pseudoalteromonas sp. ECSMB14103 TaxID=1580062 RepID=UPI00126A2186|nr:hypothetical protein [Pseudoalteromonas sp. ECSMB14103]
MVIESGESPENVRQGDFLFVTGSDPVAIKRTYINDNDKHVIELTKDWGQGNKNNQPAIVLPSTAEYKAVADALKNANLLVNDNFAAMQDWQTKTGTVNFVNIDGTTTTVKTLKQIESEAQAQLDAYHPYPWAMRKGQYIANQLATRSIFSASGVITYGKGNLLSSPTEELISEGLYTMETTPNTLGWGRNFGDEVGNSDSANPEINIIGNRFKLRSIGSESAVERVCFKFPEAEAGVRTYDSTSKVSVTHATAEIAFASETDTNKVVTDREDLITCEVFLRKITNDDPFVYPDGAIQSVATNMSGVGTTQDNVRPQSYFAMHKGDNLTCGRGVNWDEASLSTKRILASDPDNKIWFNDADGYFYQWCLRFLIFAGVGNGSWKSINSEVYHSGGVSGALAFDGVVAPYTSQIMPQGIKNENPTGGQSNGGFYQSNGSQATNFSPSYKVLGERHAHKGVYIATSSGWNSVQDNVAEDGQCYMFVIGTVNRLNQGLYHPSLNPMGSGKSRHNNGVSGAAFNWYEVDSYTFTTRSGCFEIGGHPSRVWGYAKIDTKQSGRPDGRYFDCIYSSGAGGFCRDMRYSAKPIGKSEIEKKLASIFSGQYRGVENLPQTFIKTAPWLGGGSSSDASRQYAIFQETDSIAVYVDPSELSLSAGDHITVIDKTLGRVFKGTVNSQGTQGSGFTSCSSSSSREVVNGNSEYLEFSSNLYGTGNDVYIAVTRKSGINVSGEYLGVDVLAEPDEILLSDDLKNGWYGEYICPSSTEQNNQVFLSKPLVKSYEKPRLYLENSSVNWTLVSAAPDFVNSKMFSAVVAQGTGIEIYSYTTQAKLTKEITKSNSYALNFGVGVIKLLINNLKENGSILHFSLSGNIAKDNQLGAYGGVKDISLRSLSWGHGSLRFAESSLPITHEDINLQFPSNNSRATKLLPQVFVEAGQVFINFTFNELIHNGDSWGDSGHLVAGTGNSLSVNDNGDLFLSGHAQVIEPLGWIKNDK